MKLGSARKIWLGLGSVWRPLLVFAVSMPAALAEAALEYNSADMIDPIVVDITSFNVLGDNPLTPRLTDAALRPYVGTNKGIEDIEAAVKSLESRLKKKGYSFYRVEVTSQELTGGEIELTVRRYQIGEIRVTGNRHYSDQNILASLPHLSKGASPSTAQMSRSLRVANQNSGKRTLLQLEASSVPNQLDASIQVVDQNPRIVSAWVSNTGTPVTGRYRVGVGFEHRNLFKRDHTINVSFITSPEDFDSVQQTALTYQLPLYSLGGKLNFIAVKSDIDTGTVADVFDVAGRGDVLGAGYTQVLPSKGKYRHQLTAQLTDKFFENDILFSGQQIGPDVRSRPFALSYGASWKSQNLGLGLSTGVTTNVGGGRFNDAASYTASREGASDEWSSYFAEFSLQYQLPTWQIMANLHYSGSSDRLITGEQFAIGGAASVRGMEERELSGDKGYRYSFQLWTPPIYDHLRPVLFLEGGQVKTNSANIDEFNSETVGSVGAAVYWSPTPKWSVSLAVGHLYEGIDFQAASSETVSDDGSSRAHFNVSYRF